MIYNSTKPKPPPKQTAVESPSNTVDVETPKVNRDADLWRIAREQVAQNKEIASMRTEDILARFKEDVENVEKTQGLAVTEQ
jgi:hypothetical protein